MHGPHDVVLEVAQRVAWSRNPLRAAYVHRAPLAVTHGAACSTRIAFDAAFELSSPEFSPLRNGHLRETLERAAILCPHRVGRSGEKLLDLGQRGKLRDAPILSRYQGHHALVSQLSLCREL